MEDNNYIHEGYIPRFISMCKKIAKSLVSHVKALVTIGSLSLVLAAIQVLRPDPAKEISKTINGIIQDAQTLKYVDIPDSLLNDNEVQLLKSYQSAYNNYIYLSKIYQDILKDTKIEGDDDA